MKNYSPQLYRLIEILITIALTFIIWGATLYFAFNDNTLFAALMLLLFSGCGWKALNGITPSVFLILPIGGWLIYLLVKLFLSYFIGVFVAPFYISKQIFNLLNR